LACSQSVAGRHRGADREAERAPDTGRESRTSTGGVLGAFDDVAVAAAECDAVPCRALSLAYGRDEAIACGIVCDRSRALVVNGEVAIATNSRPNCLGDASDLIVTTISGRRLDVGQPGFAGMDLVGIGAQPVAGSLVVATDGQLLVRASGRVVDVEHGEAVPFSLE
jgi:hypothetical protein